MFKYAKYQLSVVCLSLFNLCLADQLPQPNVITDISIRRPTEGVGEIIFQLSPPPPHIATQLHKTNNTIHLNLANTTLAQKFDITESYIKDFATPIEAFKTDTHQTTTTVTASIRKDSHYFIYQLDNTLVLNVNDGNTNQDTLNLNFNNANIRDVLHTLAQFKHLDLVLTDEVEDHITLYWQNAPWEQALDVILAAKKLARRLEGNILIVAPAEELEYTGRDCGFFSRPIQSSIYPLRRELIRINSIDARIIVGFFAIDTIVSNPQKDIPRGRITIDEKTNTIIAYLTEAELSKLKNYVSTLDYPPL